jgi:hypothetical protein
MELIHAIVQHPVFGQGEITHLDNEMVSVTFAKPYEKKKFLYPSAFQAHLTLADESLRSEMELFLHENHVLIAAAQERAERSDRIARFRASSVEKAASSTKSKKK